MLERKWPEKYNGPGHVTWAGRLYANGAARRMAVKRRERINYGLWGGGLFQRLYRPSEWHGVVPLMPEWYLLITLMGLIGVGLASRGAVLAGAGVAVVPVIALVVTAAISASHALSQPRRRGRLHRLRVRGLTTFMHAIQPLARLVGRLTHGLTPWRRIERMPGRRLTPRHWTVWSESWEAPDARLRQLERELRERGAAVRRGGEFDRWDLEVRAGGFGGARILSATEEHGSGRQLIRFRAWRRVSTTALVCLAAAACVELAAVVIAWPLAIAGLLGALEILRRSAMQSVAAVALTARASELLADPPITSRETADEDSLLATLLPQGAEGER